MSGKRPAGVGALCVPRARNLASHGRTIAVAAVRHHVRAVPEAHRSATRARPRRVHGSYDWAAGCASARDRRALRVAHAYRPAVAVFGRSSIRTWLNSVLSLCAPHWGQRSADDHAPRARALCPLRNYLLTGASLSHHHGITVSSATILRHARSEFKRAVSGNPRRAGVHSNRKGSVRIAV